MMQNGRSSHFYDNLRRASPDDTVVSFANAMVEFIGKVSDYALSTPKPDSFGIAGVAWLDSGWMLPVAWRPVTVPFKPSQFTEYLPASLQKNTRLSK
jgi:putative restriction endonuclease